MKYFLIIIWLYFATGLCGQSNQHEIKVRIDDSFVLTGVDNLDVKPKAYSDRTYFWFFEQTINSNQGGYHGKLLHGNFKKFDEANNLVEEGRFKKGLKVGLWKSWNENGRLKLISRYRKGRLNGKTYVYDGRVDVKKKLIYKRGKLRKEIQVVTDEEIDNPKKSLWNIFKRKNSLPQSGVEAP